MATFQPARSRVSAPFARPGTLRCHFLSTTPSSVRERPYSPAKPVPRPSLYWRALTVVQALIELRQSGPAATDELGIRNFHFEFPDSLNKITSRDLSCLFKEGQWSVQKGTRQSEPRSGTFQLSLSVPVAPSGQCSSLQFLCQEMRQSEVFDEAQLGLEVIGVSFFVLQIRKQ